MWTRLNLSTDLPLSSKLHTIHSEKHWCRALCAGLGSLCTGLGSLCTGLGSLCTGLGSLCTGLGSLCTGLGSLCTGLGSLCTGLGSLCTGLGSLCTGLGSLCTGLGSLRTGLGSLRCSSLLMLYIYIFCLFCSVSSNHMWTTSSRLSSPFQATSLCQKQSSTSSISWTSKRQTWASQILTCSTRGRPTGNLLTVLYL